MLCFRQIFLKLFNSFLKLFDVVFHFFYKLVVLVETSYLTKVFYDVFLCAVLTETIMAEFGKFLLGVVDYQFEGSIFEAIAVAAGLTIIWLVLTPGLYLFSFAVAAILYSCNPSCSCGTISFPSPSIS